ncbi:2'-5' RNA ligase family protein [Streptomyces durmitorensis]|uniref:2'-5' RNA ligase family protein n=1 Tax=Streptomyces durmitorensis TaxID=319947 RepID=A0ABY4Q7H5_9ACTN|nr:2'-5' RNA ligase family protein [Streptomyces durmitorensis]UQT61203.1 2'-5' RNA ligase family protein [Streptomyces durmitorensis]
MPAPGTTAVLALLPDAEPLLELASQVDTRVVRPGVPAHATLLYPWLPAEEVDARELERLRAVLVRAAPEAGRIPLRLAEVEQAGAFIGIPVPELRSLATAVRTAFPEQVPYGGRFGQDPQVHVTVSLDATARTAADIARRVTGRLPIRTEVSAVHVVALTPDGWQVLAEFPLTT